MKILLVSATQLEIKSFVEQLSELTIVSPFMYRGEYHTHEVSVLITGIGIANTAMQLASVLAHQKYDVVIQAGIAGSYTQKHRIGKVVEIIQENYADLGAENNDGTLLDLETLNFVSFKDSKNKLYFNTFENVQHAKIEVPKVVSNTVNLCSGTWATIKKRLACFPADIENMEGAAFFQTCILYEQSFYAFRAISNYVQPRDTTQWNIPLAIKNLTDFIEKLLHFSHF